MASSSTNVVTAQDRQATAIAVGTIRAAGLNDDPTDQTDGPHVNVAPGANGQDAHPVLERANVEASIPRVLVAEQSAVSIATSLHSDAGSTSGTGATTSTRLVLQRQSSAAERVPPFGKPRSNILAMSGSLWAFSFIVLCQ